MTSSIPSQLTSGPFTAAAAAKLGVSRKVLSGRRFVQIFPNVFALATLTLTHLHRVLAAQLSIRRSCAASHESGLLVWGVDIGTRGSVHLTTRRRHPTRVRGITMHRSYLLGVVHRVGAVLVLGPERCLVDACTRRRLPDLIAIEYDGMQHGLDLAQREHDVRRREAMEREGWIFIVVTAAQVAHPEQIVDRVHDAICARGYDGPRPEFTHEWRTAFK